MYGPTLPKLYKFFMESLYIHKMILRQFTEFLQKLIAYHRDSPLPPLMMPKDEYGRRPLNGLQAVAAPLCS